MKKTLFNLGAVLVVGATTYTLLSHIDIEPKNQVKTLDFETNAHNLVFSTEHKKGEGNKNKQTNNSQVEVKYEAFPKTKTIEVYKKDKSIANENIIRFNIEKREAKLNQIAHSYIYLLEGYSLKSEEKGEVIVVLDSHPETFVRIQKISGEFDVAKYRESLRQMVGPSTLVGEINPNELPYTDLQNAQLYTIVSEANNGVIKNIRHMINEYNGQFYKIEIFTNATEEEDFIVTEFMSILSTIRPIK